MANENNGDGLFNIGIYILIGAFAAYLILKRSQTTPTTISMKESYPDHKSITASLNWQPLQNIPSIDRLNEFITTSQKVQTSIGQSTQSVQQQAQIPQYSQPNVKSIQQNQNISTDQEKIQVAKTAYKNSERWKITRDSDGEIIGFEIIRDANITN